MRVTASMMNNEVVRGQNRAAQQMLDRTRVASSGLRVEKPSDDPVSFGTAQRLSVRSSTLETRSKAMQSAADELGYAETQLDAAAQIFVRARELGVQMATGSLSASERSSAATEVDALRENLIALANSRGANGFLFGGTRTDQAPFTQAGGFAGSTTVRKIEIADGTYTSAMADGAQAFTSAGGRDVFADLDAFATALRANDVTGIRTAVGTMEQGRTQLENARIDTGLRKGHFQDMTDMIQGTRDKLLTQRANAVEADALDAFSQLSDARTSFERSLTVTRQILSLPTLARL